ncbi:hypothetical protein [Leifsonia sp. AG29]|uniref:hypothetical protein n=1 Tax=Leifsonia sp. AG29 TaxID=2598860 RepID=UPI00131DCAA6|nr:hypothetical protein [Leifsonia sp. AG29]
MTHRISNLLLAVILGGLAVLIGAVHSALSLAPPARALAGDGHGPGYRSESGWWLGSYRLDDGVQGFCLDAGKKSPTGYAYDYVDASALGRFDPEQTARLAYISRTWAATGDRLTAAAGQVATWMVAGLGGSTPESMAARAGADAPAVLARAHEMLAEADRAASRSVNASVVVELAESGHGRLRVEVTVDRLGGPEVLSPGAHTAHVVLSGATTADGRTEADVPSGTDIDVVPTDTGASVSVTAEATLTSLPYGDRMLVAVPHATEAQSVLVAQPADASAEGSASAVGPSPRPFQPTVQTVASHALAEPGTALHDRLTVSVRNEEDLLPTWGVRRTDDGFAPVRAIVESTLHGPYTEPIALADAPPSDGPAVCTVETVIEGPGEYVTPECVVAAEGYYVWTERIDPERLAPGEGGERLRPWQSAFGLESETTIVQKNPVLAPAAPAAPAVPTELAATGNLSGPATAVLATAAMLTVAAGGLLTVAARFTGPGGRRRARPIRAR